MAGAESISFDVPLSLPKCLRCDLVCPGYETCKEPEINWLRNTYEEFYRDKRPKRIFTPYTQRCTETAVSVEFPYEIELQHSLGANLAPLTARALFLARRLRSTVAEINPRLSTWRLGMDLKINKSQLKFIRHSTQGEQVRSTFLHSLVEKTGIFLYQQDQRSMIENIHVFDAFICALTGYLKYRGCVEPRPKNFPENEIWIDVPVANSLSKLR
jgi:hypothetical protein